MPEFQSVSLVLFGFFGINQMLNNCIGKRIVWELLLRFIVGKTGLIADFRIEGGDDNSFDSEALLVIEFMLKWKFEKQGEKTVKVKYIVPINLELR